ncbi:class I SAM-dependent methyltransferase [Candidatus Woesearchaeota archaeon]|jgi:SAM-dependent methyltransferase|nr:class I SAM-dependent methyltransferase [Candidatus Woesearchaeota archaeon]
MANFSCDLCGSINFKELFRTSENEKGPAFFPSSDVIGNDLIVQCKECKLSTVHPLPDEKKIIEEYSEYVDERFANQAKGREITSNRNLEYIEKFKERGEILDIGTANAPFLHIAKKRGWTVTGIELNKYLIKWAKENYNLDIKQGTIFENTFNKKFDVITLWDVLEHVSSPSKTLEKCNLLLKQDGLFVINYPDYQSWIAKMLGKKWPFYLSVHIYYFDRRTIKKILNKAGFKVIKIRPHIQHLDLGYILFRARRYIGILASIPFSIVKFLKLENKKIPYWIGQTLVVATKND